jgi:hypothetical protein
MVTGVLKSLQHNGLGNSLPVRRITVTALIGSGGIGAVGELEF